MESCTCGSTEFIATEVLTHSATIVDGTMEISSKDDSCETTGLCCARCGKPFEWPGELEYV